MQTPKIPLCFDTLTFPLFFPLEHPAADEGMKYDQRIPPLHNCKFTLLKKHKLLKRLTLLRIIKLIEHHKLRARLSFGSKTHVMTAEQCFYMWVYEARD